MAVVVTFVGEEYAVDKLMDKTGSITTRPEYIGWGTGAGTAAKADTTLFTEAAEARTLATVTKTGTGTTAKLQAVGTLTSLSGQTITNAGLLTAAAAGSLIVKGDHTGVALLTGDQIQYTFTIDPS